MNHHTIPASIRAQILDEALGHIRANIAQQQALLPQNMLKEVRSPFGGEAHITCPEFAPLHQAMREVEARIAELRSYQ